MTSCKFAVAAGLSHTPRSEKSEVSFSLNEMETYLPYTKALRDFLVKYEDDNQRDQMKYEDCGGRCYSKLLLDLYSLNVHCYILCAIKLILPISGAFPAQTPANPTLLPPEEPTEYKNRGDLESDVGVRKACRFSRSLLGPCSGIEDREFGFKEGKPCLIVKLNRIVNFRPRVIQNKLLFQMELW